MIEHIQWLGHGSILIDKSPIIYIDPWRIVKQSFDADIILVSHDHYDHCSVADIEKLRSDDTVVIGNEAVSAQVRDVTIIRPWQSMTIDRLSIKAIPAYTEDGFQHPKEQDGLGFVISMNYYDIYYAGDTGIIPEMSQIHPDIAILPIDGNDTLSVEQAIEVVDLLRPRWVIPCNWGKSGEGASTIDAVQFARKVGGRAEVILPDDITI